MINAVSQSMHSGTEAAIRDRFERFAEDEVALSASPNDQTIARAANLLSYSAASGLTSSYAFGYDGSVGVCISWPDGLDYFDLLNDGRVRYYSENPARQSALVEADDAVWFLYQKTRDHFAAYLTNFSSSAVTFTMPVMSVAEDVLVLACHA